jgi:hypothetical protein
MPDCLESGEDAGDLAGALFVLTAEAGSEGFGVLADTVGRSLRRAATWAGRSVGQS